MPFIIVTFLLFSSWTNHGTGIDINEVRSTFHQSVMDSKAITDYYHLAMTIDTVNNPTALAYRAAGYVMKAKNHWNPLTRIKLVMKYRETINEAVRAAPKNVEVRFLRFSIAYYLPNIFGLKQDMEIDKTRIFENISATQSLGLGTDYNKYILWFVTHSAYFTDEELSLIQYHLSPQLSQGSNFQ